MSNAPHVIATVLEKSTKTLGSQIGQLEKLLAEAKDVHTAVEGAVEEVQTLENQRAALAQNLEQETRAHAADLQRLVELFPPQYGDPVPLQLIAAHRASISPVIQRLRDFLVGKLEQLLERSG